MVYDTSQNPKWARTDIESDSKTDFLLKHSKQIKVFEKKIYNDGKAWNRSLSLNERIRACKKSITAFYEFETFCYNDYGGIIYFQDMWEHCHNSREACFSYLEQLENQLEKLEYELEKEKELKKLESELLKYIRTKSNTLQSELFNSYSKELQQPLKKILKKWEDAGIIIKIKYKNTYLVEFVKQ